MTPETNYNERKALQLIWNAWGSFALSSSRLCWGQRKYFCAIDFFL